MTDINTLAAIVAAMVDRDHAAGHYPPARDVIDASRAAMEAALLAREKYLAIIAA